MEKYVDDLNKQLKHLDFKVQKLTEDNISLSRLCDEQEERINRVEKEMSLAKEEGNAFYKHQLTLEKQLVELERELKYLTSENAKLKRQANISEKEVAQAKGQHDKMFEDNSKLYEEIQKLKLHVEVVTEQNHLLEDELNIIKDQDQIIKSHLQRRNKISDLVTDNRNRVVTSSQNVDY